jgi:hypothetical protein
VPDWYGPSFYALELLMMALSIGLAVLLFRESARDYFAHGLREPVDPQTASPTPPLTTY